MFVKYKIWILAGAGIALVLLGVAFSNMAREQVKKIEPRENSGQDVVEVVEVVEEATSTPSDEGEITIEEKVTSKDPAEVQKTKSFLANLKNLIEGDPRRAIFLCSADPCVVPTQRFEVAENGSHLDCGGGALAPEAGAKVGIYIKADDVIIENCVLDGFDTAIEIEGANSVITKNTIKNSAGNGILVQGQKSAIFENTIENNKGAGIFVAGESNEHAIADNIVRNNGTQGLHIFGAGAITAIDNKITGNKSEGIWLSGNARENLIYGNTIQENGGECSIFLSKIGEYEPKNNRIEGNTVDKTILSCQ